MVGRLLCWLGYHDYEEFDAVVTNYSRLIMHRCKRCKQLPPEQRGLL
jgi:hypothetical protein